MQRLGYFLVDKVVIKLNLSGIHTCVAVIDAVKMSPIDSPETHRTGLA